MGNYAKKEGDVSEISQASGITFVHYLTFHSSELAKIIQTEGGIKLICAISGKSKCLERKSTNFNYKRHRGSRCRLLTGRDASIWEGLTLYFTHLFLRFQFLQVFQFHSPLYQPHFGLHNLLELQ